MINESGSVSTSTRRRPGASSAKNWCFTSFLPADRHPTFKETECVYMVYQRERCPSTGKEHWQGFLQTKIKRTMQKVKSLIEDEAAHLEVCRSIPHAMEYCRKADTRVSGPYEKGDKTKVCVQGKRVDLEEIKQALDDGKGLCEISSTYFSQFIRYSRGFALYKTLHAPTKRPTPHIIVITGPSGIGKSLFASIFRPTSSYWLRKPSSKGGSIFWDGYDGQDCVVIDEFYGWIPYDLLLRILDRYPLQLDFKGGAVSLVSKHFIFTSNKPWRKWYKLDDVSALERRLKEFGSIWECESRSDTAEIKCNHCASEDALPKCAGNTDGTLTPDDEACDDL